MSNFLKMDQKKRREMILNGNISRTMAILSVPVILMSVVQSFIPLTDGLFINRFAGYLIAAAITFAQPLINILNGLGSGIAVAASAVIGQQFGKGDMKKVKDQSLQIVCFSFIVGLCLIPIMILISFLATNGLNEDIRDFSRKYISLYSLILPMLFMANIYNAFKNATGNPEATFYRMVILLSLKIFFNFIFLYYLKMKLEGVILASFVSYIFISLWMFYDLFIKESPLKLNLRQLKFEKDFLFLLIKLAVPSMLNIVLVYLGFVLINFEISSYGSKILNANGIAGNINQMMFTVPSSVSTIVTTMISINIGYGNSKKAKEVLTKGIYFSLIISLVMMAIFLPGARIFVRFFNDSDSVIINTAVHALNLFTLSIAGFAIYMVCQGAFIGLGITKITILTGVLRLWFFRYLFILLTKKYLGVDSIFYGNVFSNYMAALVIYILTIRLKFKSAIRN